MPKGTTDSQTLLEIRATQVLNPGERLLWVGKHSPWEKMYVVPTLTIGLFVGNCVAHKDFAENWWMYLATAFVASLVFGIIFFEQDRRTILALTDCRLLVIYPGNEVWWRLIKDIKAMQARINAKGSGKLQFKFQKAELGHSHKGKEQRRVSSQDLTFPILQDGESLKQLIDQELKKKLAEK